MVIFGYKVSYSDHEVSKQNLRGQRNPKPSAAFTQDIIRPYIQLPAHAIAGANISKETPSTFCKKDPGQPVPRASFCFDSHIGPTSLPIIP